MTRLFESPITNHRATFVLQVASILTNLRRSRSIFGILRCEKNVGNEREYWQETRRESIRFLGRLSSRVCVVKREKIVVIPGRDKLAQFRSTYFHEEKIVIEPSGA